MLYTFQPILRVSADTVGRKQAEASGFEVCIRSQEERKNDRSFTRKRSRDACDSESGRNFPARRSGKPGAQTESSSERPPHTPSLTTTYSAQASPQEPSSSPVVPFLNRLRNPNPCKNGSYHRPKVQVLQGVRFDQLQARLGRQVWSNRIGIQASLEELAKRQG